MKVRFVILAWLCVFLGIASGADVLHWDARRDRVEAEIETWTVPQLLEHVAGTTGWQVFLDPSINNVIPTKFKERPSGEALQRLLGSYNYALVPHTNGSSRLYVFRNTRADATKAITPLSAKTKKKKGRIENELVVTLKPGEKIDDLARKHNGKVAGKIDELNTHRLRFDDAESAQAARESLQDDSSVASVDENFHVSQPETPAPLGGAARPLGLNPQAVPDGKYLVVGLIDTAVPTTGINFADFLLPPISVREPATLEPSAVPHGPPMAETILRGLASANPEGKTTVRILPVDVYGNSPSTSTFDVATGIYRAVNEGANIINLSLGSEGDSSFLHNTIINAHNQGIVFLAAAGNEPVRTPTYPAAYPEVIAVTAGDRQGNPAPYANRGDFIDVMAPGTAVVNYGGMQHVMSGTSVSTAYASGLAAATAERSRLQGRPDISAAIRSVLTPAPQR